MKNDDVQQEKPTRKVTVLSPPSVVTRNMTSQQDATEGAAAFDVDGEDEQYIEIVTGEVPPYEHNRDDFPTTSSRYIDQITPEKQLAD